MKRFILALTFIASASAGALTLTACDDCVAGALGCACIEGACSDGLACDGANVCQPG